MNLKDEVRIALQRARQGTGALFIAVQDVLGFLSVWSADVEEEFVQKWLAKMENMLLSFATLDTGNKETLPEFSFGDLGKYYYYVGLLNSQFYVIALFPKRIGAAKILYTMGGIVEELKGLTDLFLNLREGTKERYLERKKEEGLKREVRRKRRYLSIYQIEAIKEAFLNEIGPAGEYIFNATIRERNINGDLITKEDAYELIDYLVKEIDSLERSERFVKTALSIIDEEAI